jgi:metallo-beta-lactamase family protein
MTLTLGFYGGAGTVTGSRFLLDRDGHRLLVDCGLFQGLKQLRLLNWNPTPFDPRSVEAVILTHAHIDHSGYLPRLVKAWFEGPIYCSAATRDLAEILLRDAAKLQEEDAEYANRKGFSKHHPALPLFTEDDAVAAIKLMRPVEEGDWFEAATFSGKLHRTGHILGACFVEMVAPGPEPTTLVFSGDLGRYDAPMHADPEPRPECDTLILESTYGDRQHSILSLEDQLREPFMDCIRRRGTILIPAFAVARAQLVLLLLRGLMDAGHLPNIPIHIDSPMAVDVTNIYRRYAGSASLDVPRADLYPKGVQFHRTVDESKKLNHLSGPRIIISASGMLTGGRVLHHLERLLPDARNLIVLVGYQAAGTRGRSLLEGARTLRMHGRDVPVRAHFLNVDGLSAHADRHDLLRWLRSGPSPPRTIFLTHGERTALDGLAEDLKAAGYEVVAPELNDRFALGEDGRWRRSSF